ncbi:MAG: FkbM family methyltransferase [Saprospiraceae bacterium]|nr:FkbM family methyltransferase [Saprospiraceae bacterium]
MDRGMFITDGMSEESVLAMIKKIRPVRVDVPLVRIGPNMDGGYLVPDDFDDLKLCISPGVGPTSAFELECAKMGMEVLMADASVDGPAAQHDNFHFVKKFVNGYQSSESITFDQLIQSHGFEDQEFLLQMDIESSEYDTILSMSEKALKHARIILLELHDVGQLWNLYFYRIFNAVWTKLQTTHYCVHLHPNNCAHVVNYKNIDIPNVIECSFIRKDRAEIVSDNVKLPHTLDFKNGEGNDIELSTIWSD